MHVVFLYVSIPKQCLETFKLSIHLHFITVIFQYHRRLPAYDRLRQTTCAIQYGDNIRPLIVIGSSKMSLASRSVSVV